MSVLRIFGLLCAIVAFAIVFFRLRKVSSSRFDVWVLSAFGVIMLLISLFPGLVNLPSEVLSLDKYKGGRLLTLLIVSNVALWFLMIYERSKSRLQARNFDELAHNLATERFLAEYGCPIVSESILVVVPAYNESENLAHVFSSMPEKLMGLPVISIVIDDGSTDNTVEFCRNREVMVARNMVNRGGGAALRLGFQIARQSKARIVVTMDGDGQHSPEEIATLIAPVMDKQADLVIGSRILGGMEKYSQMRYAGVKFFAMLISSLIGRKITDPASGFRAFNQKVLQSCSFMQDQYHTPEMIIEVSKRGLKIVEQPVHIKRRLSGESKKGKDWKYALYFLRTIIQTWFR
jgi:hypothetical protein